jgi:tetratricopeptide (TPR) repeat protein
VNGIAEPEVLDLLARLVEKSLVVYEEDEEGRGRYRLLETVRQYATEKLAAKLDHATLHCQHRYYFLSLAEQAKERLHGPEQRKWLERLDADYDNFRAALDGCSQDERGGEAGLRVTAALQRFWEVRGYFDEARENYQRALAHPGAQHRTNERAAALHAAGCLAWKQADYAAARDLLEQALSVREERGDEPGIAASLGNLGVIALQQGDYERARGFFERVLALSRGLDAPHGQLSMANALGNLGNVSTERGDYAAARGYYEDALAAYRALGNDANATMALMNLGNVASAQGDDIMARACYDEALAAHRKLGNRRGIAVTLSNLGLLACGQRELSAARAYLAESLQYCREMGDRRLVASGLEDIA